ncbi:aromatic-ring-hydroxylating dioxygenase subunit beta [Paraconexibacter antarcticus]|uniref:Aromatic-ring-hydroxylating dioxygenase subunit beta n=1 Tax=Paraconexibacter antarcticus TaxID=2949664 RepID=A0ABY5DSG4_9ACTN|nr:aromatic-ring-hydroxylating dioxygenase subunit beta [Paraconexibacter antarcticus]UTI63672.1 aromatic-ring-hydroxylating dioxygenase subunit beta [Paraconexibacter antarcticus]
MHGSATNGAVGSGLDVATLREVEQFIYREARYQDELEYDAWEALWTDDAIYWVPANGGDSDPTREVSILFDNRARIATRIKQLHTGKRHSQTPPSQLRRIVSNVELLDGEADGIGPEGDIRAGANFLVYESRERGVTLWAGRSDYTLRRTPDGLRMAYKKVTLVDSDRPLYTLAFLI